MFSVSRVVGGVAAGLLLIGSAAAAPASLLESGTYDIYSNGYRVGSERFTWSEAEGGLVTLEGECVREVGGVSTTLRPSLTLEVGTLAPKHYMRELARGDRVDQVEATFEGGKAVLAVRENGSSSKRNVRIKSTELVVDEHFTSLL